MATGNTHESMVLRQPLLFGCLYKNPKSHSLTGLIKIIEKMGFCLVVTALNGNHLQGDIFQTSKPSPTPFAFYPLGHSDLALTYDYWSQRIVGYVSQSALDLVKTEVEWSTYVGTRAIAINLCMLLNDNEAPEEYKIVQLSQLLATWLKSAHLPTIWIVTGDSPSSLKHWQMISRHCNLDQRIKVALALNSKKLKGESDPLLAWLAEPIASVVLDSKCYVKKRDTLYVNDDVILFLQLLLKKGVKVILDVDSILDSHGNAGNLLEADPSILDMADAKVREAILAVKRVYGELENLSVREMFGSKYSNVLQDPLQPLRDNLSSVTYEHFEICHVKYRKYELAFDLYLNDFLRVMRNTKLVIYVVGAGRGPLVDVVLTCLGKRNHTNYTIYALDKNPFAIFSLKHKVGMNTVQGWDRVQVVHDDMRYFDPPELAHVVLSELLGSFGDNELSPECIDGIQTTFERKYGKSNITFIPSAYESYLAPIAAPQAWSQLYSMRDVKAFNCPYSVYLSSWQNISETEPLKCFEFSHPNKFLSDINSSKEVSNDGHNDRFKCLDFVSRFDTVLHGFLGFFSCRLYQDVVLDTRPGYDDDQISWFPYFLPIETALPVTKGSKITVFVWRRHDANRVWYEWTVSSPYTCAIHNVHGSYSSMGR